MSGAACGAARMGRDPRPDAAPEGLRGGRCGACGYPMLYVPPLCPACGAPDVGPALFGPGATVWSCTVLRVRVADRKPPAVLAYADFDDGPRALAHVTGTDDEALPPGARVTLLGRNERGDPLVSPAVEGTAAAAGPGAAAAPGPGTAAAPGPGTAAAAGPEAAAAAGP